MPHTIMWFLEDLRERIKDGEITLVFLRKESNRIKYVQDLLKEVYKVLKLRNPDFAIVFIFEYMALCKKEFEKKNIEKYDSLEITEETIHRYLDHLFHYKSVKDHLDRLIRIHSITKDKTGLLKFHI